MSFGNHIIHLNDTKEMPLLGLGTYKMTDDNQLKQRILEAFSCGYHLIDTASFYKNEEGIGKSIKALSIPRSELFITTKLWNTAQRIENIEDSFYRSLERLGLDYLDLYLVHWPVPGCFCNTTAQRIENIEDSFYRSLERLGLDYLDLYLVHWPVPGCFCNTWRIFEKLQASGVIKSIGVSNFSIHDLELLKESSDIVPAVNQVETHPLVIKSIGVSNFSIHDLELLKESSDIVPAVNQVETHPLFQNPELITYCQKSGITLQAYAPLARGAYLNSPLMIEIGNRHKKTPAQIGLRWLIQQNIAVIPKSEQKNHLEENSKIFDFSLTPEEMAAISAMNTGQRIINPPEDIVSYL